MKASWCQRGEQILVIAGLWGEVRWKADQMGESSSQGGPEQHSQGLLWSTSGSLRSRSGRMLHETA